MKPGVFNLDLYRGDSYAWRAILWEVVNVTPTDLTDCIAAAEIREKTAGIRIAELACVITLPNIIDISMDPSDWANCPTAGVWDLQLTFPSGVVRTVLAGTVKTTGDVVDSTAAPAVTAPAPRR